MKKNYQQLIHARRHSRVHERVLLSPFSQILLGLTCLTVISLWIVQGSAQLHNILPNTRNTLLGACSGFALTILTMRQIVKYPGAFPIAYALPAASIIFGILVSALFILRLDYSTQILLIGFIVTVIWAHAEYFLWHRYYASIFAVVPKGEALELGEYHGAEFFLLTEPDLKGARINGIVADLRTRGLTPDWERFLANCTLNRIPVYHTRQIRESLAGRVKIDHLYENEFGALLPSSFYEGFKRLIDILFTVVILPLLLPILFITAVAIRLESKGPVFFIQTRMGFRGKPFKMIKFRSMYIGKKGAGFTNERNDPRITKVGRFIRKYRFDELPQIWNILLGQMSYIGPRPESMELSEWYQKDVPFFAYRHVVRPGISGWAQVNQGYAAEIDGMNEKLEYDFYYIKHFSFWLDTLIVFKTIKTILTGFGAR